MRRSRFLVTALLVTTFAAGAAAGVAADRLWIRPSDGGGAGAAGQRGEDRGKEHEDEEDTVIERFSEELGLTSGQEARIDTILKHYRHRMKELRREVRPRYDALVDSARRRIEAVLDSAQVRKYRKLLERKSERKHHGGDEEAEGRTDGGSTGDRR